MRILVTGGTGFTGSALAKRLLEDGHEVLILDRRSGIFDQQLRELGAEIRVGSVTDPELVNECMTGVDVVQHLAAAFRELNEPDRYYYDVNVRGTQIVAESALRNGVGKFVHCSTCGVHGDVENPPAAEDDGIAPADYYQETKYIGELVARDYADRGLDVTILRPCALYGPGDPGRFLLLLRRVAKGVFPMFGDGDVSYHTLSIDNFVDALVLAMRAEDPGRAFLIADEECPTIEQLVHLAADVQGVDLKVVHLPIVPIAVAGHVVQAICRPLRLAPPIYPRRVDWFRQTRSFDITRARRELGYNPRISLREGLQRAVDWYRENDLLPSN